MDLEGFRPYIMAPGSLSISFSKNGLGISKAAVAKLRNSPFVKVLLDMQGNRFAIQVCEEDDEAATEFARSKKPEGIRWNTKDLTQTLQKMIGRPIDNKECYRFEGEYLDDDLYPALVFDLNEPEQ